MIILVDPVYNPEKQGSITSATKLGAWHHDCKVPWCVW